VQRRESVLSVQERRGRLAKREREREREKEKERKRAICLERGKMKESK